MWFSLKATSTLSYYNYFLEAITYVVYVAMATQIAAYPKTINKPDKTLRNSDKFPSNLRLGLFFP